MPLLENIRKQPHHKRIRLIWICVGVAAIVLIILWVVTWRFRKEVPRDTTLFDTIGRGFNDLQDNYNKPIQ